jgi:hypothetical protein
MRNPETMDKLHQMAMKKTDELLRKCGMLPPSDGPWWVMGQDSAGEIWIMLGPVSDWVEASGHIDQLDAGGADSGWCFWLWTLDQVQVNNVQVITHRVLGAHIHE